MSVPDRRPSWHVTHYSKVSYDPKSIDIIVTHLSSGLFVPRHSTCRRSGGTARHLAGTGAAAGRAPGLGCEAAVVSAGLALGARRQLLAGGAHVGLALLLLQAPLKYL